MQKSQNSPYFTITQSTLSKMNKPLLLPSIGKKGEKTHPIKAILAGGIAGGLEICITYPTEYVKTQMQLQSKINPIYKNIPDCIRQTIKQNGVLGLYTGLSPLFWMSIPKVAIRFMGFTTFRNLLLDEEGNLNTTRTFLAGLGAGTAEAIFAVTPMETIKTKFCDDQRKVNPRFRNFIHGVKTIVHEQGIGGIYKGLAPTILKQASNQGIRFVVYGKMKDYFQKDGNLSTLQMMASGFVAGAASVFGNTPLDVIKTKMQGLDANKYGGSMMKCIADTWKHDGLIGFYRGTGPRLARVCLDVAITMTLFEKITSFMNSIWPTPEYDKRK